MVGCPAPSGGYESSQVWCVVWGTGMWEGAVVAGGRLCGVVCAGVGAGLQRGRHEEENCHVAENSSVCVWSHGGRSVKQGKKKTRKYSKGKSQRCMHR